MPLRCVRFAIVVSTALSVGGCTSILGDSFSDGPLTHGTDASTRDASKKDATSPRDAKADRGMGHDAGRDAGSTHDAPVARDGGHDAVVAEGGRRDASDATAADAGKDAGTDSGESACVLDQSSLDDCLLQ